MINQKKTYENQILELDEKINQIISDENKEKLKIEEKHKHEMHEL